MVLALFAGPANATLTLSSGNSTATIDPSSQAGMYNWTVNGVNQLYQQWFWYALGTGSDQSIDTLGPPISAASLNGFGDIKYGGTGFTIEVVYNLTGGAAGQYSSDLSETINIMNLSTSPLNFHFFQYSDFDLNGTPNNQTVLLKNANTIDQFDGTAHLSETVATPPANEWEVGLYDSTLHSLNSGAYKLNNAGGPVTGDATWAFEWDQTIGVGQGLIISKDKKLSSVVPEPATILGFGVILLLVGRKFQKRLV
jgi:hypothetical protein